jgi:hypothetical protein
MKVKTVGRIYSAAEVGIFSFFDAMTYKALSHDYESSRTVFESDMPLGYKALAAVPLVFDGLLMAAATLGVVEGVVDFCKGTHHYLGMKTWKALTRNPERKEELQKDIDYQFEVMDKDIRHYNYSRPKIKDASDST